MCGPHFLPLFFSSHLYHLPRFLLFRHTRVISRTLALLLLASFSTSCPSKFMDPKGKLKMGKMAKREADFESDDDEIDHLAGGCAAEEDDGGVKKKKVSSAGLTKKGPWGGGAAAKGCQVEKCVADLIDSKQYHRRHKVCEHHAKAQVVLVAGIRQRFCQQCSRFHELGEFDDAKRSCRRRLAGHNERRRKSLAEPQLGEGSSRKGTGSEVRDMMCGSVDDRGRIKLSVQETASYKHFQIS